MFLKCVKRQISLARGVLHVFQNLAFDHITIRTSTARALGCGRPAGVNVVICTPPVCLSKFQNAFKYIYIYIYIFFAERQTNGTFEIENLKLRTVTKRTFLRKLER
jgi:hypothetical protein